MIQLDQLKRIQTGFLSHFDKHFHVTDAGTINTETGDILYVEKGQWVDRDWKPFFQLILEFFDCVVEEGEG